MVTQDGNLLLTCIYSSFISFQHILVKLLLLLFFFLFWMNGGQTDGWTFLEGSKSWWRFACYDILWRLSLPRSIFRMTGINKKKTSEINIMLKKKVRQTEKNAAEPWLASREVNSTFLNKRYLQLLFTFGKSFCLKLWLRSGCVTFGLWKRRSFLDAAWKSLRWVWRLLVSLQKQDRHVHEGHSVWSTATAPCCPPAAILLCFFGFFGKNKLRRRSVDVIL